MNGYQAHVMDESFHQRLDDLIQTHEALLERPNLIHPEWSNGVFDRYVHPVLTSDHTPLFWRYDLDPSTNPFLMERLGVNAVFNPGAILLDDTFCLMCRVEGYDRKSFFAVAESTSGVDGFRFRTHPVVLPGSDDPETNLYDMRLIRHEDGWIYGLFCTERKHPDASPGDTSSAVAQCGIVRTRDLLHWERLPDLRTPSPQQRNVVLHPEFVDGCYGFYTRPQDDFIEAGSGGGIGWGICDDVENPLIASERIVDPRVYHTIKELKNGAGPAPVKTPEGWLHIVHGVRGTAAGLRYVLYAFLCDLSDPARIIHRPGGYLMAPWRDEFVGDVGNVLFCNGVIAHPDGTLYIYYASADLRIHVATTTVDRLLDYVKHTPEDSESTHGAVRQRLALIDKNLAYIDASHNGTIRRTRQGATETSSGS